MSPVMNQGELGSCTAHAGAAIMEYYQNRVFNHSVRASRLFLYKVTRNLAKQRGDTGAELRTTMQALVMIGAPPEEYYPYDVAKFDAEPTAFLYALADDYRATAYYRHDVAGVTPQQVIESLQQSLAKGLPSMFGTTVYKSFPGLGAKDDHSGQIPFPGAKDRVDGGHAMVIVGYDNPRKEFLVRNSWGDSWGNKGYGWLPYAYVTSGLATDFWTLLHAEFTDPKAFA
jgi:C1A family cysteine protease